ncbi:SURF1 family protein [Streptacidiphilus pinicola]|uniref:SURF1-like protein n=1 Tax=Streptacidiphilus pinicola TaxID=2219663 RepID=A0A2X0IEQ7_9ACTN|nr:SURF1 family protein [Streptacidiphilus pinicola]RAG83007.1 SURF1 family protein [Streptacidiphilus pinicola]
MYRTLLTPRWLALHLLALVAVPVCIILGLWQLSRFELHSHAQKQQAAHASTDAAPTSLAQLLGGADKDGVNNDDGRRVSFSGSYDAKHQLLVPQRTLNGRTGSLVVTPLRLDGSGTYLAVVRGWLPGAPATVPAPPGGDVAVTARLRAAETPDTPGAISSGTLPSGQLGMISPVTLVNALPYSVWNGYASLDPGTLGTSGLTPVPYTAASAADSSGGGMSLQAIQNLGYVGQWFVFAGFVVFMWFRFVRREVETQRDRELGLEA